MNKAELKKKFILFICILAGVLVLIAAAVVVVDPYFHFHAPLKGLSYEMSEERYINDGISRHFDFDGIITGTSMNQNFKTSEAEALFGGKFVKEPYSGAAFKELMDALETSLERNPDIDKVIWGMDYSGIRRDADYVTYTDYPEYLYDDNPFNDVEYVFNKEVLYRGVLQTLIRTLRGEPSTTFDEYSSWVRETGFDHIMLDYDREETKRQVESGEVVYHRDEQLAMAYDNIENNIIPVVSSHPDVDFYIFFSPYSMIYWDSLYMAGITDLQIDAEQQTAEQLLEYDNVHLFCFFDETDLILDLSLYNNKEHYSAEVNSQILRWMAEGSHELTKDNLAQHIEAMREFYDNFDYATYMESKGTVY